jgi:hypothetical protein
MAKERNRQNNGPQQNNTLNQAAEEGQLTNKPISEEEEAMNAITGMINRRDAGPDEC